MAGRPILSSSFPQVTCLLKNGYDSIVYGMFDKKDLKVKLEWAMVHTEEVRAMKGNTLKSGEKYTFSYNEDLFLHFICGER